jgi:hypothetical protein
MDARIKQDTQTLRIVAQFRVRNGYSQVPGSAVLLQIPKDLKPGVLQSIIERYKEAVKREFEFII